MNDVRSITRRDGISLALMGLAALILGPIVTALGAIALFGLIFGPILILGGIVAMAMGGIVVVFPMMHGAVRKLGASGPEREAAVRAIDAELASSVIAQLRLSSGAVLRVTPSFFVLHGNGVLIARREDLLWGYSKVTTHRRYGITTGRTNEICFVTRRDERTVGTRGPDETASALALFSFASPRALAGYRDDVAAMSTPALAAYVDRMPFDPHAVSPSALPGSPFAPGGPLGASMAPAGSYAPGPFVPGSPTYGAGASEASAAWAWAATLTGGAMSALGVVLALFFAWVALHPQQADDTTFGALFSILSFVACAGPGLAGLGFGLFRLHRRYGG